MANFKTFTILKKAKILKFPEASILVKTHYGVITLGYDIIMKNLSCDTCNFNDALCSV